MKRMWSGFVTAVRGSGDGTCKVRVVDNDGDDSMLLDVDAATWCNGGHPDYWPPAVGDMVNVRTIVSMTHRRRS